MDDDIYTAEGRSQPLPASPHDGSGEPQSSHTGTGDDIESGKQLESLAGSFATSKASVRSDENVSATIQREDSAAEHVANAGLENSQEGRLSPSAAAPTSQEILSRYTRHFPEAAGSHEQGSSGMIERSGSSNSSSIQRGPPKDILTELGDPAGETVREMVHQLSGTSESSPQEWQSATLDQGDILGHGTLRTNSRSRLRPTGIDTANEESQAERNILTGNNGGDHPGQITSFADSERTDSGSIAGPRRSSRRPVVASRDTREILLPRWQPDAEVTYCPICRTQFSFFVRKHHCRKCGRVVCNACSPHRITIPYQYIVQPPLAIPTSATSIPQLVSNRNSFAGDTGRDFADRNGGMKVRLCNPCVPDPNPLPPQQFSHEGGPPTLYLSRANRPHSYIEEQINNNLGRTRGMSAASGLRSGDRRHQQILSPPYEANSASLISHTHNGSNLLATMPSLTYARPIPRDEQLGTQERSPSSSSRSRSPYSSSPAHSSQIRGHGNRPHHQSLSFTPGASAPNPQPHYRSLLDIGNDQYTRTSSPNTRPLPPIPRVAEEDECPVCHRELLPRTYPDSEDHRASHIAQCIEEQISLHSGSASRPGAYTSQTQPVPTSTPSEPSTNPRAQPGFFPQPQLPPPQLPPQYRIPPRNQSTPESRTAATREAAHAAVVRGLSHPSTTTAVTSNNPGQPAESSPSPPARRTGMFLYSASEKDCIDDAECTICLEEFVVGAAMARLECFCRFHHRCIGDWFVNHPGMCPVHSHDGYGF